ncbi:MAG: hypothetical protein JRF37_09490 [Deltaproteobacteria bacterium]|nr:hypothetical protein [Deltaproteobacteria bacterium]
MSSNSLDVVRDAMFWQDLPRYDLPDLPQRNSAKAISQGRRGRQGLTGFIFAILWKL